MLARADRAVVPVITAVAIEIGLADFGPVLARVRSRVAVFVEAKLAGVFIGRVTARGPSGIEIAERAVDRVAKFVDGDASSS